MRSLLERLSAGSIRASVQTGDAWLTFKEDGDRIDYTVWAFVLPYFGEQPANDSVYVFARGRTPGPIDDLVDRMQRSYRSNSYLMEYDGSRTDYPYTKGKYTGLTSKDVSEGPGSTTYRLSKL